MNWRRGGQGQQAEAGKLDDVSAAKLKDLAYDR